MIYPTRSKERTFGTNPLSIAAPGKGDDAFVLDMATSTVAFGKVEISNLKGEKIPTSWGADKNGQVILFFKVFALFFQIEVNMRS